MIPEITVSIKTKKGILSFTSDDKDAVKKFMDWATGDSKEQQQKKTTQKKGVTQKQYDKLLDTIRKLKEEYGEEAVMTVIKDNDITINEKMSAKQLNRAYAILRQEFKDAKVFSTGKKRSTSTKKKEEPSEPEEELPF